LVQRSGRAIGFVEPCQSSPAKVPLAGPDWLYEIKHGGQHPGATKGVRLITRNGNDFSMRFPLVVAGTAHSAA